MGTDIKKKPLTLVVGFVIAAVMLAGCSSSPSGDSDTAAAPTRTVEDALGQVTVPEDPQRIVALDELAGISALAAGHEPIVVFATLGDTLGADILRDAGVDVREAEVLSLPTQEALLELDPDLIVGVGASAPAGLQRDELATVAPTAIIDIEGEWRDLVVGAADIFGEKEAGERQVVAIEEQLAAAVTAVDGKTLALVGYSVETFTMPPHSPSSTLIADAGFLRVESETAEHDGYSVPISPELLKEHDADIIVVPDGPGYPSSGITDNPLFGELTGTTVHPVAQQWLGNSVFSFWVIAKDLRTLAEGGTDVLQADDLVAEWGAFMKAVDR